MPAMQCLQVGGETALDPESGEPTRLFHPRRDVWSAHFEWRGFELRGITPIGRATVVALQTNSPTAVDLRRTLASCGLWNESEAN